MQGSHTPTQAARPEVAVDDTQAASPTDITVPAEIMLGMAASVIDVQREALRERDLRICVLERLLKLTAEAIMPPNVVIH
jgi:hypothetical protein